MYGNVLMPMKYDYEKELFGMALVYLGCSTLPKLWHSISRMILMESDRRIAQRMKSFFFCFALTQALVRRQKRPGNQRCGFVWNNIHHQNVHNGCVFPLMQMTIDAMCSCSCSSSNSLQTSSLRIIVNWYYYTFATLYTFEVPNKWRSAWKRFYIVRIRHTRGDWAKENWGGKDSAAEGNCYLLQFTFHKRHIQNGWIIVKRLPWLPSPTQAKTQPTFTANKM